MNLAESATAVRLVKERYQYLKLTEEQALQIARFELPLSDYSEELVLTEEEKCFYQKAVFKDILSPRQFRKFQVIADASLDSQQQILQRSDQDLKPELDYELARLHYLKTVFLPSLYSNAYFKNWNLFQEDGIKLDFVRNEYRFYLNRLLRKTIIHQYRYFKYLMPNQLQLELIRVEKQKYWPSYPQFKASADIATIGALDYLCTKVSAMPSELLAFLSSRLQQMHAEWEKLAASYLTTLTFRDSLKSDSSVEVSNDPCSLAMTVLLIKP